MPQIVVRQLPVKKPVLLPVGRGRVAFAASSRTTGVSCVAGCGVILSIVCPFVKNIIFL